MKNSNQLLEDKIRNLTFITVLGFVLILLLIIGLYFKGGSTTKTTPEVQNNDNNAISYDISKFEEVNVDEALELFDDNKTHVLYIGRSDCSFCQKTAPVLTEVQEELEYTTKYLAVETNSINKSWNEWQTELKPLVKKLSKETTMGENTDTFGNLLTNKGYTPAVIIIKKGKMVDGFFGYKAASDVKSIIEKYL